MNKVLGWQYALVGFLIVLFTALLVGVIESPPLAVAAVPQSRDLILPILALVGLTAAVWVLMFAYRNLAVIRGVASLRYYQTYASETPAEWVERPARTFMNLLEVPQLFYLVCVLMLLEGRWDNAQLSLAWLFVATRYLHAVVYIGSNYVPLRLASYAMGCITVTVIWFRFAKGLV